MATRTRGGLGLARLTSTRGAARGLGAAVAWLGVACVAGGLAGCGGAVASDPLDESTGGRSSGATGGRSSDTPDRPDDPAPPRGGADDGPDTPPAPTLPPIGEDPPDDLPVSDWIPPECEDVPVEPLIPECDLWAQDCGIGWACSPSTDYADNECEPDRYTTRCEPAGLGRQGDGCELGCAAGHLCVVTGAETICTQLCNVAEGSLGCPDGLLCVPIDVQPGVGGCY